MVWVYLAVTALLLGSALLWAARIQKANKPEPQSLECELTPESSLVKQTSELPLVEPRFNPLEGLSFEDSLDGEKFALNVQVTTERALAQSAKASGFQLGNLSLQALSASRDGFVVTFDKGTAEFVKTANGVYKAQTRGTGGAFKEIGNIDQIGTWAHRAASVASITVATANLISNADASKKLGKLLDGQERMFAYRAIDQHAGLKTAYEELREELARPVQRPEVVDGIRHRIRNIRHIMMEEAKQDLAQLEALYPQRRGVLKNTRKIAGDWYKRTWTKAESERLAALDEFRGKLLLARHCVTFEDIAASATKSSEHQAVLLAEAEQHLLQMLPRYQGLEAELLEAPSVASLLEQMFATQRSVGGEA